MKRAVASLINRLPLPVALRNRSKQQGAFPPGHYYSPIPSDADILSHIRSLKTPGQELPGIELNAESQYRWLVDYSRLYKDLPFPEKQTSGCRYWYDNEWFGYSDAIFLYTFLRTHMPTRIIEVGSGFSSAVILDTVERHFSNRPDLTFIEPHPDRLKSLLKNSDQEHVRLIENRIQDVSMDVFLALEPGDFLFIDSSHVVKCGSDLHLVLFEILPRLQPGVFVFFHDVFYPFEYPVEWLREGRFWNENYFLRAFLSYNTTWKIHFFTTYVHLVFGEFIQENMPLCLRNTGGGLFIRREAGKDCPGRSSQREQTE